MTWALIEPGFGGDYWPEVEMEGYRSLLADYWRNEISDEDKKERFQGIADYRLFVSLKFSKEIGTSPFGQVLTPLLEHEAPTVVEAQKSYKNLASMIRLGHWAVDEDLKVIIEEIEPGVHQFWPVTITMPRGKTYPKHYYVMVIGTFLDSFRPEACAEGLVTRTVKNEHFHFNEIKLAMKKADYAGLAFSKAAIGDHHLWRERTLRSWPEFMMSDKLKEAIDAAGLRMPKLYPVKDV